MLKGLAGRTTTSVQQDAHPGLLRFVCSLWVGTGQVCPACAQRSIVHAAMLCAMAFSCACVSLSRSPHCNKICFLGKGLACAFTPGQSFQETRARLRDPGAFQRSLVLALHGDHGRPVLFCQLMWAGCGRVLWQLQLEQGGRSIVVIQSCDIVSTWAILSFCSCVQRHPAGFGILEELK